jgi:hypothetical protein
LRTRTCPLNRVAPGAYFCTVCGIVKATESTCKRVSFLKTAWVIACKPFGVFKSVSSSGRLTPSTRFNATNVGRIPLHCLAAAFASSAMASITEGAMYAMRGDKKAIPRFYERPLRAKSGPSTFSSMEEADRLFGSRLALKLWRVPDGRDITTRRALARYAILVICGRCSTRMRNRDAQT